MPEQENRIVITCPQPHCQAQFRVPVRALGRRGPCPRCGMPLVVTRQPTAASPSSSLADERVRIRCPHAQCHAVFLVTRKAFGRTGPCLHCRRPFTINQQLVIQSSAPDRSVLPRTSENTSNATPIHRVPVRCRQPQCRTRFRVHPRLLGQTIACPRCGAPLVITTRQPARRGRGGNPQLVRLARKGIVPSLWGFGIGAVLGILIGSQHNTGVILAITLGIGGAIVGASFQWGTIAARVSGGMRIIDGLVRIVLFPIDIMRFIVRAMRLNDFGILRLAYDINRMLYLFSACTLAGIPYLAYVALTHRLRFAAWGIVLLCFLGILPLLALVCVIAVVAQR